MGVLVQNKAHRGVEHPQHHHHQDKNTSYSNFLATHLAIFSGEKDTLEADDWLHTDSKFGLLHCTEYQKTLYAAQHLRGLAWAGGHLTLQHCCHTPIL
jgi:hypothetical protein